VRDKEKPYENFREKVSILKPHFRIFKKGFSLSKPNRFATHDLRKKQKNRLEDFHSQYINT